jgi:hypothetical protein
MFKPASWRIYSMGRFIGRVSATGSQAPFCVSIQK